MTRIGRVFKRTHDDIGHAIRRALDALLRTICAGGHPRVR